MSERIDTKAVLANPLWLPEDTSTGIVYRCGYCSTIQSKSIYVKERHTNSCPRPALVQEIADREALEKKLRRYEGVLQEIATTRLFIRGKPPAPSFAEWCQTLAKSALAAEEKKPCPR